METRFTKRQITPMSDSSDDAGPEKLEAFGTVPNIPDEDGFKLMMDHKRTVVKVSLFVGIPLVYAMAIKNFIKGDNIMAFLNCMMLLILTFLGFVAIRRIDEKLEYKIYSILFRLFFAVMGVSLIYEISFQSNFSRIEWCYIYPILVFLAVGVKEGVIWVFIFYGILAFFILNFDLQGINLFQIQELRSRFLISFFAVCMLSLFLEYGFRRAQQRLLHHQRILKESENRYRQAYEQLNIEMQERKRAEEALSVEKQRFQTVSENAPFGIALIDQAGTYKYINHKFRELFGYDLNDIPDGKTWFRKAYPDPTYRHHAISTWITDNNLESSKPGEKISRTFTVTCKDGTEKIINICPVKLETGEYLTSFVDFTLHKKAEETLRRSEEEAKRLAQENAVMAEIGRIISSTLNIEEVYERFAEEVHKLIPFDRIVINTINIEKGTVINVYMAGKGIADRKVNEIYLLGGSGNAEMVRIKSTLLIQTEDFNEYKDRFPMLLSTFQAGFRSIMNVPLFSKGQIIGGLLLRSYKPYAYTDRDVELAEKIGDQVAGAIANAQLFIERKRAEEALRQSEEKYRTILENIQDGYFEVDLAGNFTFVNDAECAHLGYSREELIGMNNRQYTDKENAKKVFQAFNKLYRTGEPVKVLDYEVIKKDGTKMFTELSASLIRDSGGKPIGFRGVARDVTERKRAEEERAALQEQLRQSQKMEAVGKLAGGIAHDFNNLLTVITGYSDLILRGLNPDDPMKGDVEEIKMSAEKATSLTQQLLAFSRKQVLQPKVLDLNAHVSSMDKMLRRMIGEDIELVTLLAEDLGRIKADPGQIEQVILNLSINAKYAMPNGGKLTIETANIILDENYSHSRIGVTPGRYVMLSVSDNGVGMTPEIKERIFEPFFTTKEKGKGTGLGLSTVYGIIQQSGGNIWVYSEPGVGTTFKIYLPTIEEGTESLRPTSVLTKSIQGFETILLVEDEEMVRKLARTVLQKNGYTVLEASNGEEALRMVQEQNGDPIHLVVTDVVMPGMSGRQLAERLVSLWPEMKVLYMSGYTDDAIVHHGVLDAGIAYIQKPFSPDALVFKVREILDRN